MKADFSIKLTFPKIFLGSLVATSLAVVACGEEPKRPVKKDPTSENKPNSPTSENKPNAPASSAPAEPGINVSPCESIQKIKAHLEKKASAEISASDSSRYCLHTISGTSENIIGQPLENGLTVAQGMKLLIADISKDDFGVTYAKAKEICESIKFYGGGFTLPKVASTPEEKDSSIEAISAYIKHSNQWDAKIRFWVQSETSADESNQIFVPKTAGLTSGFNWGDEALLCAGLPHLKFKDFK